MPATPMKLAALRYSPEMALAFQPTETLRPATKKSEAVLEVFAERKPIQIVTMTVTALKARIQGSMVMTNVLNRGGAEARRTDSLLRAPPRLCVSAVNFADLGFLQRDGTLDENVSNRPDKREEQHAEHKPCQCEAKDARRHRFREEIVEQRQTQQRDEE